MSNDLASFQQHLISSKRIIALGMFMHSLHSFIF